MNEKSITSALARKYSAPEFAFLSQVRNSTGFARTVRTADALALGLYPSRGIHLHGFEIKINRADLKRELVAPDKAEEIARFCNFWWIVAPKGMCDPDELPDMWGLQEMDDKGKLRVAKKANMKDAEPLTALMLAGIMRAASTAMVPKQDVDAVIRETVEKQVDSKVSQYKRNLEHYKDSHQRLQESVAAFEEISGVTVNAYTGPKVGEAVRIIINGGFTLDNQVRNLKWMQRAATEILEDVEKVLAKVPELQSALGGIDEDHS